MTHEEKQEMSRAAHEIASESGDPAVAKLAGMFDRLLQGESQSITASEVPPVVDRLRALRPTFQEVPEGSIEQARLKAMERSVQQIREMGQRAGQANVNESPFQSPKFEVVSQLSGMVANLQKR